VEIKDRLGWIQETGITYNMEETKSLIRAMFKGHMKHGDDPDAARIILLIGNHGEGKTRALEQVALEMGWAHDNFHAGAVDSQDNTGLQKEKDGQTIHSKPRHIPIFDPPKSKSGYGVFVIEEFGSNDNTEFQNQARQMAEGRLGEFCKHPNWLIAATSNPESDQYLTVNKLDAALVSRLVIVPLKTELEEKLRYWRTKTGELMFEKLYWFLLMNRGLISAADSRSWYNLGKTLRDCEEDHEVLAGTIYKAFKMATNKEIAAAFEMFQKKGNDPDQYPISGEQLLSANVETMTVLFDRLGRWIRDPKNCGVLVQATKHDMILRIRETAPETANEKPENIAQFLELITTEGFADMAQDVLNVLKEKRPNICNQVLANMKRGEEFTPAGTRLLALMDGHMARRAGKKTKTKSKDGDDDE